MAPSHDPPRRPARGGAQRLGHVFHLRGKRFLQLPCKGGAQQTRGKPTTLRRTRSPPAGTVWLPLLLLSVAAISTAEAGGACAAAHNPSALAAGSCDPDPSAPAPRAAFNFKDCQVLWSAHGVVPGGRGGTRRSCWAQLVASPLTADAGRRRRDHLRHHVAFEPHHLGHGGLRHQDLPGARRLGGRPSPPRGSLPSCCWLRALTRSIHPCPCPCPRPRPAAVLQQELRGAPPGRPLPGAAGCRRQFC
jgi:hypothetical protein